MDIMIAVIVWYATGFIAVSWSYYWKIRDNFWIISFVALAGFIVIPQAIIMHKEYKDLK